MFKKYFSTGGEKDPLALFVKKGRELVFRYFKYILALICAGFLFSGSYLLYQYNSKRNNQKASAEIYKSEKKLLTSEEKAGGRLLRAGSTFSKDLKKAPYAEIEEALEQHLSVILQWIKRPAGALAVIKISYFLDKYGKNLQALELLEQARKYHKKGVLSSLISYQAGVYLMNSTQYEKAQTLFDEILKDKSLSWLYSQVLLLKALALEKQNKMSLAGNVYKEIIEKYPESSQAQQAEQYLNFFKVEQK